MLNKNIELFNKAIHNIKRVANDIAQERKKYHVEITDIRNSHDKKMKLLLKEQ